MIWCLPGLPARATGAGIPGPAVRQDAATVRQTWKALSDQWGEEDAGEWREAYGPALERLLSAVEAARPEAPPADVVQAFGVPWSGLRRAVSQRGGEPVEVAFREHAAALQRFLEWRPGGLAPGRVWQVPRDGSLSDVYRKAAWGDTIQVRGRHPRVELERPLPAGAAASPVRIVGPATLTQNPVGGSSTLTPLRTGFTVLERLDLELDDTAAVMFQTRTAYRSIHFRQCRIGLAAGKGWNAETDEGYRGKWGLLSYELDDFRFEDGEVVGVHEEHCFYHHNPRARSADDDAILIRGTTMKWAGRTAVQVTARRHEGPDGRGNVRIEDCVVEDVCLEDGGGGSALTFRGNLDGTVLVRNTRVHLGGNPLLHPSVSRNITGALVMDAGADTDDRGTRELIIDGCHFEVGPAFVGEGSARRNNVDVSAVGRCTIRGTTILSHPGARAALRLDGGTIGRILLDPGNDIRGDCILEGLGTFPDPERDGAGYRALLEAVAAARALPEEDPRREVADRVEILAPEEPGG